MTARSQLTTRTRPAIRRLWRRVIRWRAEDLTGALGGCSVLVVAPHPDDETLGCGALIARLVEGGTPVDVLVVTDGRGSHPASALPPADLAAIRAAECVAACGRLGLPPDRVHALGIPEGLLAERTAELVERLTVLIERSAVTDLFVPSALDWHPDHQLVRAAGVRVAAARPTVRLLEYPVWFWADGPWASHDGGSTLQRAWRFAAEPVTTLLTLRPVLVRTAEAHRDAKRRALEEYRSQVSNLTGEPDWATLDEAFLEDFLGDAEVFFRGGAAA